MSSRDPLTPQDYAIRAFQLLEDFGSHEILIDTVLVLLKMLTRHPIRHAILYATGDAFRLGAIEFDQGETAQAFLRQLAGDTIYASFVEGEFTVFRYPYYSRVLREWVFLEHQPQAPGD